jgi:hypothetical protein
MGAGVTVAVSIIVSVVVVVVRLVEVLRFVFASVDHLVLLRDVSPFLLWKRISPT